MTDAAIVNKHDLAAALRWSRPRLDRYLAAFPNIPAVQRGTRRQNWRFNLQATIAFIVAHPLPRKPPSNGWGFTRFKREGRRP